MEGDLNIQPQIRATYPPPALPQFVHVTNANEFHWFSIGFRFGFGFMFAAAIFCGVVGLLVGLLKLIA